MRGPRLLIAPALAASLIAVGGCGGNERDQVQAKLKQLAHATANKDYRMLCGDVLAPSLLAHLAVSGLSCEQAMRIALAGVHNPVLSIGRITVNGRLASAVTLTGAVGQQGSVDQIGLVKTGSGWRIASLGSPGGPAISATG